ncbi:hypothetical protein Tco_1579237 [Tanacetum coccineum]
MYPILPNNTAYSAKSILRNVIQQIHTAYSNQLNTAYRSPDIVAVVIFRNRLMKKGSTMAEPNLDEYIYVTRKNYLSDDNEGRIVEKTFLEIQGTFLVRIRDNAFNGIIGENAFEHIKNFLEVVGPLKIKGVSHDRFRLSVFPISLTGATGEWFKKDFIGSFTTWEDLVEKFVQKFYQLSDNNEEMEANEDYDHDDIAEIFKIKGNLFDFETPLCKAFNEFNYLLKIDTYLFTFDIQEIKTYEEHEYELNNNMTVTVVARDFYKKFYNSLGSVPNRCSVV